MTFYTTDKKLIYYHTILTILDLLYIMENNNKCGSAALWKVNNYRSPYKTLYNVMN